MRLLFLKANENGYRYFSDYLAGIIQNKSDIGWYGNQQNLTVDELLTLFFEHDYNGMLNQEFNNWLTPYQNVSQTLKFLFPHGFCKEIYFSEDMKFFIMNTKEKRKILLTDPNRRNKLRTEERSESWMSVGPTKNGLYEAANYEVALEIHNNQVDNGRTCMDYTSMGTSYGDCIENALHTQLLQWYGCIPVWFPPDHGQWLSSADQKYPTSSSIPNHACINPIKPFQSLELQSTITFQLWHLVINQDLECMKNCLPPCVTMTIKPRLMTYRDNFKEMALLEIIWDKNVIFTKSAHSIDFFDLVVELGSALGLWLGLSALSLLDLFLMHWPRILKIVYLKKK